MKLSLFPLVFLFHILFILINAQSESEASGIEGPYFEICVTNDSTRKFNSIIFFLLLQ